MLILSAFQERPEGRTPALAWARQFFERRSICAVIGSVFKEAAMAYVMFQYDRPTDTRNWNNYNGRVEDWISQLLDVPGAVSFMAYRTADGASPDTRKATTSEQMTTVGPSA
jgi:hypothetical protein